MSDFDGAFNNWQHLTNIISTKVPKPLMEKRRRERINHSLETLRRLLLENTRNEVNLIHASILICPIL